MFGQATSQRFSDSVKTQTSKEEEEEEEVEQDAGSGGGNSRNEVLKQAEPPTAPAHLFSYLNK